MFDQLTLPTILNYGFMQRALLAGTLIALTAPVIGNLLLIKRFTMITDTLAHMALLGVAVGLLTGWAPLWSSLLVTSLVAVSIEWLRRHYQLSGDSVLALMLPTGLALTLLLLSLANGFNANLFSYLFGSVTTVQSQELWPMLGLSGLTLLLIAGNYRRLLFSCFDEVGARLNGINTTFYNLLLMLLVAVTVALSAKIIGALLVSALIAIPSLTSMRLAKSFKQSFFYSVGLALLAVHGGLWAAFYWNLPAGAAIVLLALGMFVVGRGRRK